jgi:hypothetical protein
MCALLAKLREPNLYLLILIVQGATLDYDYIAHWAQQVGATEVWNQLLAEYRRALS